jgi:hypothetical protein
MKKIIFIFLVLVFVNGCCQHKYQQLHQKQQRLESQKQEDYKRQIKASDKAWGSFDKDIAD